MPVEEEIYYKEETIPPEIAAQPPFEPVVIEEEFGPVSPEAPPIVTPYLATFFMDIDPKKIHDVKVKWAWAPWETALEGTTDCEVSTVLPVFFGKVVNNSDIAGKGVFRDQSKSFSIPPLSSTTLEFGWRVKGLDIVRWIWAYLTKGKAPVEIFGRIGEAIFEKEFRKKAEVPVR